MTNTIAEQIYEAAKPLPEPLALEALHFIEYLRFRTERDDSGDWLLAQETALKKVWDDDEDEAWNDAPTL
jgi:hypothetical protein